MVSASNEQLQQELEYTLLKPDCHSWWFSKMQSGSLDALEEWYAIKLCFKHGKHATETYGMLLTAFRPACMNRASVFEWHKRFKEGRESVRDDRSVGGVRKSIDQSWLVKGLSLGLGLGLLCWGFKGVQEEIPSEEVSTLQIGSVAFPPGQFTYAQLHPFHRLFKTKMNRELVFEWHKRFKEGRESVRDDERCGRSKEVNRPELIGQRVRVTCRVTMLMF